MEHVFSTELTPAQRLKLELMQGGLTLSAEALEYIRSRTGDRPLTLADYASTTGVSLKLEGEIWVNAPTAQYNPNFVFEPGAVLTVIDEALAVARPGREPVAAKLAPVPEYHRETNAEGIPFTEFVHTHTDRARISPIRGCAMRCKFCDIPYEFKGKYWPKPVDQLIDALRQAIEDPVQPAAHVLISGGTPAPGQRQYLKETYRSVLDSFPDVHIDIMMVPHEDILDLDDLEDAGVHELSLNLEIFDVEQARRIMPEKAAHGLQAYLDFIERAVGRLGTNRVRSMLMIGLEDESSTLDGVKALVERGCTPVLSPFRPDPITELAEVPTPTAAALERVYLAAREIAEAAGIKLGPSCKPCMHNTLTFPDGSDHYHSHGEPFLI